MSSASDRVLRHDHAQLQQDGARLARQMTLLDVSARVVDSAATVAVDRGLRGYDAVHLASAALLRGSDVAFVSGDRALLRAAGEEGFITVDSSGGGR